MNATEIHLIRARWQAGETSYAIARSLGNISRQAIDKRAKTEGWKRGCAYATRLPAVATKAPEGSWLERVGSYQPCGSKDRAEVRALILEQLEEGMPKGLACQLAGVHVDTLRTWVKRDPNFSAMVLEAERTKVRRRIKRIEKAGETDFRAAKYLLQSDPLTKDIYADNRIKVGQNITVILGIPRADPGQELKVIDG